LKFISVVDVDSLLLGSGNEDITLHLHVGLRIGGLNEVSMAVVSESTLLKHLSSNVVDIEPTLVIDGGVVLDDTYNDTSILLEEFCSPVADSSKALNHEGLSRDSLCSKLGLLDKRISSKELLDAVVDSESSTFSTSSDTTLVNEFTSAAAFSVDVLLSLHLNVGVLDPSHDLLVSSHVGTEAVNTRSNKTFLGEFHGVPTSDFLNFSQGIKFRVNANSSLCSTERNISDTKFVGHEGSKSHCLLEVDSGSITSSTLDRQEVMLVLGTVGSDSLDLSIVSTDRESESDDRVTRADEFKPVFGNSSGSSCLVEELLDILKEAGFLLHVGDLSKG